MTYNTALRQASLSVGNLPSASQSNRMPSRSVHEVPALARGCAVTSRLRSFKRCSYRNGIRRVASHSTRHVS